MKKKIKYIPIILIFLTQLAGCKANDIKGLENCWGKVENAIQFAMKDIENFPALYKKEEEKALLFLEDWVKNPPTVRKVEKITIPTEEEIKTYLNMTIGEIEKLTGNTFYSGTTMVFSFVGFYTVINLENAPFDLLCIGYDVWKKPAYVSFNYKYAEEYLKTINLSQNMNFNDIMNLWGRAEIEEINRFEEYHYRIGYERNDLIYEFVSDNKEGNDFRFYISQKWTY